MPDRCILCGDIIPEGRQVCWTCEMRELSAFDSSLQTGDIMRELNCDRRDAELIMDTFGGMQGHRRTVGLRALRLHQLNGDIAELLSASGEKRRETAAIMYLKRLGYSVSKPEPDAKKEDGTHDDSISR